MAFGDVALAAKLHGHCGRAIKAGAKENHAVCDHWPRHNRVAIVSGAPDFITVRWVISTNHVAAWEDDLFAGTGVYD